MKPGSSELRLTQKTRVVAALMALNLFAPAVVRAQEEPSAGSTHAFVLSVPVMSCTFDGNAPSNGAVEERAPRGAKFQFVQSVKNNETVVIQFLDYTGKSSASKSLFLSLNAPSTTDSDRYYFCLSRARFDRFSRRAFATGPRSTELAVGALVLPVKLRPGTASGAGFDFANDVAFGTSAGARMRILDHRELFVSLLVGVALSSVSLTAENTADALTTTTDRAAFTWTTGAMIEANKFQLGVFIGQDRISQPKAANWAFQGKTWFGLGLGYALFGAAPAQPARTQ